MIVTWARPGISRMIDQRRGPSGPRQLVRTPPVDSAARTAHRRRMCGPGPPECLVLVAASTSLRRRMTLIDGKAIAQQVRDEVREEVAAWVAEGHDPPGLA